MLELEVIPEHGLSSEQIEFLLGMHFSSAVSSIQSHVGHIKGVEISYCDKDPLAFDLSIKLSQDGIKLMFDSTSQRLKIIEVYDLSLVRLKYGDLLFNCPDVSPTIEQIDQSFGATRPGVYDEDKKIFTLTFRGLAFEFPAETEFQPSYGGSRRELGKLQFPPGSSPCVSNMAIYTGSSLAECAAPAAPLSRYPSLACRAVEVVRSGDSTLGLTLVLEPNLGEVGRSSFPARGNTSEYLKKTIKFGDSVQDVMSAVGAPNRIFYKSEDKMKIHSPNAHRKASQLKSDYFYNYFTFGMDLLFDAKHNKVKKFILHTNFPGHYNFNMYHRCEFSLTLKKSEGSNVKAAPSSVHISPYSKWEGVANLFNPAERPVVLNRASSTNTTNPFGSTFCYGYQDIIFEVMPNGHIASLTLYLPPGKTLYKDIGEADQSCLLPL